MKFAPTLATTLTLSALALAAASAQAAEPVSV
jgi:hypothetical protein